MGTGLKNMYVYGGGKMVPETDWLITARRVLAPRPIRDGAILVEDGRIAAVGSAGRLRRLARGHERVASDGTAAPGLVNCHTHLPETLLRGICSDRPLWEWLHDHVWAAERRFRRGDALVGALLGCAESLHAGVTCVVDQYFFADAVFEAVERSGMRALLCPSVFEDCPEAGSAEKQFARAAAQVGELRDRNPRIRLGIGPHAPYSLGEDLLRRCGDLASRSGARVHIHLSETAEEVARARKRWGCTPVEYLDRAGLLDGALAAHCVHPGKGDYKLLRARGASVVHCPTSNLKLGSGVAPVARLLDAGVDVLLGTDGCASNDDLCLLEEARLAALLQKGTTGNPALMPAERVFRMLTSDGARAAGFPRAGVLAEGREADIVLFPRTAATVPDADPVSNLIYCTQAASHAWVAGRLLMEDGEVKTFDERRVWEEACRARERVGSSL